MALIIPPGFGNAAFIFTSTTGTPPIVTTLGVNLSAAGGDFVEAANVAFAAYAAHLLPETDTSLTLDRVNLAVGDDGPGGSVDSDLAPAPGTRSGTGPPVSMSTIVRKVTNDIGRRGRGRMFLPGLLTTTNVDESGIIASGRRDEILTAVGGFIAELFDTETVPFNLPPVLLHSSAPADPTPLTGAAVSPLVGWIRGRIR